MKKIISILLLMVMMFSLCACGKTADRSTQMATAKTFMKFMIDCDVNEVMKMLVGNAHDSYLFMTGSLIEFANMWMQGTQLSDWLYYQDKNSMLIWNRKSELPQKYYEAEDKIPVIYIEFAKVDKNEFSISELGLSNSYTGTMTMSQIWDSATASSGSKF